MEKEQPLIQSYQREGVGQALVELVSDPADQAATAGRWARRTTISMMGPTLMGSTITLLTAGVDRAQALAGGVPVVAIEVANFSGSHSVLRIADGPNGHKDRFIDEHGQYAGKTSNTLEARIIARLLAIKMVAASKNTNLSPTLMKWIRKSL